MFENVRADIAVGTEWHRMPRLEQLIGERAGRCACVLYTSSVQVVLIYRLQAWLHRRHVPVLPELCQQMTMLLASVQVGNNMRVGPGLLIAHGNVIIDGYGSIGTNCQVSPFVTIGLDTGGPDARFDAPNIGDGVFIGTGAKILGPVTIGDNARIGANAVVMSDVPADSTAVGIPARVIPHDGRGARGESERR